MCSILAMIGPRGTLPDDAVFRAALATMSHRAPDGAVVERHVMGDVEAVLCHGRLAIVGLADGAQPVGDGRARAVVNGEFYGWREVRSGLERRGRRFVTGSDSELAPRLFDASTDVDDVGSWTDDLSGEWCLALLDREARTLWAACDRWGTKPLRWWTDGRRTAVATEAKALFALGVPRALDLDALAHALRHQYLPWGRTLFRGIRMVPPGGHLRVDGRGATEGLHARPNAADAGPGDLADVVEAAVACRIPDERDFCTHLSGGLDSAVVTAHAVRLAGRRVAGYCAAFPWAGQGDETADAQVTAGLIGAELRPVVMHPRDLLDAMDEAPIHSEGLANNLHAGAKILVARAAHRDGFRVALTGEGADEGFLGYEFFRDEFPVGLRPPNPDANPLSLGIMRSDASSGVDGPSWAGIKARAGRVLDAAFGPYLAGVPDRGAFVGLPPGIGAGWDRMTPVGRARVSWMAYGMSGYILRGLDDPMGMSQAVESRLPFLDRSVQAAAAAVPDAAHFAPDGLEKHLLREAARGVLPDEVRLRPKRAFLVPSVLAQGIGRDWAHDRLLDGTLDGLLRRPVLEGLLASDPTPVRDGAVLTLACLSNLMRAFAL